MRTKIIVSHRDGITEFEDGEKMIAIRDDRCEVVGIYRDPEGEVFIAGKYHCTESGCYIWPTGAPGIYTTRGGRFPWKKIELEKHIEGCVLPEEKIGTTIVSNFFVNVHEKVWPTPEKENPLNLPDKISKLIAYANTLGFDAIITGTSNKDMTITFR